MSGMTDKDFENGIDIYSRVLPDSGPAGLLAWQKIMASDYSDSVLTDRLMAVQDGWGLHARIVDVVADSIKNNSDISVELEKNEC